MIQVMHFFYCDNIKGILILVKNDKGIKFGVFIKKTCDGDYNSKKDENAFCLSIPLKKINKIIDTILILINIKNF